MGLYAQVTRAHFIFKINSWRFVMLRDSRNMDLGITFNYERMLNHCKVFDDKVCYAKKTHYE